MIETESAAPRTATTASTWWHWPVIPFAALGAAFGAGAAVMGMQWLGMMFSWGSTEGWYWRFAAPIWSSGAFGFALIWAACRVAPKGKRETGIVALTVLVLFVLTLVAWAWLKPGLPLSNAIVDTVTSAALVFGAFGALSEVRQ